MFDRDEDEEEQPVKKSRVSAAKKTMKTKKDKKYVSLTCLLVPVADFRYL